MQEIFCIGSFCFQLAYDDEIQIPLMFQKFRSDGIPEYFYEIEVTGELPKLQGDVIARRADIVIAQSDQGESRLIGVKGIEGYYAHYREIDGHHARVWLAADRISRLHIDPVFSSLLALERRLIERKQIVLHCAYVRYQGEAILFSAPSETGKTTQANLWEKYRGAETIKGDRALLSFEDDGLVANGWPVCGTSEVCENQAIPVRAIVMLSQSDVNQAERMRLRDAFMQLYSQVTINTWNRAFTNQAMDLIERLLVQTPVYHLGCTISEEAVVCLEQQIFKK